MSHVAEVEASLLRLPSELFPSLISTLDAASLASFSLVSKQFNSLSEVFDISLSSILKEIVSRDYFDLHNWLLSEIGVPIERRDDPSLVHILFETDLPTRNWNHFDLLLRNYEFEFKLIRNQLDFLGRWPLCVYYSRADDFFHRQLALALEKNWVSAKEFKRHIGHASYFGNLPRVDRAWLKQKFKLSDRDLAPSFDDCESSLELSDSYSAALRYGLAHAKDETILIEFLIPLLAGGGTFRTLCELHWDWQTESSSLAIRVLKSKFGLRDDRAPRDREGDVIPFKSFEEASSWDLTSLYSYTPFIRKLEGVRDLSLVKKLLNVLPRYPQGQAFDQLFQNAMESPARMTEFLSVVSDFPLGPAQYTSLLSCLDIRVITHVLDMADRWKIIDQEKVEAILEELPSLRMKNLRFLQKHKLIPTSADFIERALYVAFPTSDVGQEGSLTKMKFLRSLGCKWPTPEYFEGVVRYRLDILRFAVENGAKLGPYSLTLAVKQRKVRAAKFLKAKFDFHLTQRQLLEPCDLGLLNWMNELGLGKVSYEDYVAILNSKRFQKSKPEFLERLDLLTESDFFAEAREREKQKLEKAAERRKSQTISHSNPSPIANPFDLLLEEDSSSDSSPEYDST